MKCEVLAVRETKNGFRIAHIKVGQLYGDVPCDRQFAQAKEANLKPNLRVRNGRFEAFLLVENLEPR